MTAKKQSKTVNGIQCPLCKQKFYSRWTHDFRRCDCGYCFVDGGEEYLRMGWGVSAPEGARHDQVLQALLLTKLLGMPKQVRVKRDSGVSNKG